LKNKCGYALLPDNPIYNAFVWFGSVFLEFLLKQLPSVILGLFFYHLVALGYYAKAYNVILKSSFVDDKVPEFSDCFKYFKRDYWKEWKKWRFFPGWLWDLGKTLLGWFISKATSFSRPSIKRLLYVAFHPFWKNPDDHWWKRRIFLDFLSPKWLYHRAIIYIETDLLTHTDDDREEQVREKYKESILKYAYARGDLKQEQNVITCTSCFDVFMNDSKDKIASYFKAQTVKKDGNPRFLSTVIFQQGYLSPIYLVSGPLSEFDQDWTKLINSYDNKLKDLVGMAGKPPSDPLATVPNLRKLQTFIWDCWVQWGPSVPICSSNAWTASTGAPEKEVALQFGYGDENNSLPICLDKSKIISGHIPGARPVDRAVLGCSYSVWKGCLEKIGREAAPADPARQGLAFPVNASGRLSWINRGDRASRFCSGQQDTKEGTGVSEGWMVFEADSIEGNPHGPLFYSAYVWVLIAICGKSTDQHGKLQPIHQKNEYWKCLIPFFQHGNIAEASVYEDIKKQLATKTVDTLIRQLEDPYADELHFGFAASSDENGDSGQSQNLMNFPGTPIFQLMIDELEHRVKVDFNLAAVAARIHLTPDAVPAITACQLPSIVRSYLDQIESMSDTVGKEDHQ
jgi:hypothetical protein